MPIKHIADREYEGQMKALRQHLDIVGDRSSNIDDSNRSQSIGDENEPLLVQ